jgi:hypothetical protein
VKNALEATMKQVVPSPLKEGAKSLLRGWGIVTSGSRQLPDFLLIGTKRGGTTSMFNYLLQHPLVAPMFPASQLKSPHYFDINYGKGLAWYRSHFPTSAYRARLQRRHGRPPVAGEASPYYLFHPLAAERVHATLPEVKLIVLLRDPVDRAFSHYRERVNAGTETLGFEEALEREPERLAGEVERILADPAYYGHAHDFCSYLARGRYLEQLRPWMERFGRERFLVLRSEDFYADVAGTYGRVLEFLSLPPFEPDSRRRHAVVAVRTPALAQATRERLAEYYAPHNRALEEYLGMDLGWTAPPTRRAANARP